MHLTRPATVLTLLALAVGIVGQWSADPGSLPWWRVMMGIVILGLLVELLLTRGRAVRARVTGARFFLGRETTLTLEFDNLAQRPLALRFVAAVPDAFDCAQDTRTLTLGPLATTRTELGVRARMLGRHRFEELPGRIRGPLGLAWWSRRIPLDADLLIVPDTLGQRSATPGIAQGGSSSRSALGGSLELHHLREYQPGDSLNTIDWKATAKSSQLMTRVFNEDQHLEIMLLVDTGRTGRTQIDGLSQFGHYANLAARFAEYCVASDDRVGLVAFSDRLVAALPPGRGLAAVQRLRQTLAGLTPAPVESDVLQAALYLRRLLRHRCFVVILTDLYERSASSQLVQASRLLLPAHLPLVVGITGHDVSELAEAPARGWLDPYRSLAAREYRRHVGASMARLTQMGAQALAARPEELDRKVFARYDLLRAQRRI